MSLTRSVMLKGTAVLEQGPGRPSLHGISWDPALVVMWSIRTSSCVLFTWYGAATTNPAAAISSKVYA